MSKFIQYCSKLTQRSGYHEYNIIFDRNAINSLFTQESRLKTLHVIKSYPDGELSPWLCNPDNVSVGKTVTYYFLNRGFWSEMVELTYNYIVMRTIFEIGKKMCRMRRSYNWFRSPLSYHANKHKHTSRK